MAYPLVAIVGRPNVGKSTFFNKMVRKRVAIVEDIPGVTRDRIYGDVEWLGRHFTLIDTGGLDPYAQDVLLSQMRRQAEIAVDTCEVVLFFVDGRQGLTADDHEVAAYLRKTGKPVLLVVNKVDHIGQEADATEFWALDMGQPATISSTNLLGLGDLCDAIVALLPDARDDEDEDDAVLHIAVIGRPNVGKSSLVNRLLGEERVLVSDIPGTTRDAIDTELLYEGRRAILIDTAGVRRKGRIEDATLERYSVIRSLAAIRRCDVALLVIDALDGVTEQDAHLAGYIADEGKAVVVLLNKWDAVEKETGTFEKARAEALAALAFMDWAEVLTLSALTGQRSTRVMPAVFEAYDQYTRRITTGVLNDAMHDFLAVNPPPAEHGRRMKLYYATQGKSKPPTFSLFVNDPELMHYGYMRYLENCLRKTFGFAGTPLRLVLRARNEKEDA